MSYQLDGPDTPVRHAKWWAIGLITIILAVGAGLIHYVVAHAPEQPVKPPARTEDTVARPDVATLALRTPPQQRVFVRT